MPQNRAKFHYDHVYEGFYRHVGPYVVYQIGDLICDPGYHVEEHEQLVYEITYIVSGEGTFYTNGEAHPVEKGTLFLNRIAERHEIFSSEHAPLRYFYLGFKYVEPMNISEPVIRMKDFLDNPANRIVPASYNAVFIQDAFINLFTELTTNDFYSDVMIESYIQQIVGYTYRTFSQKKFHTYSMREDADQTFVYDIINFIDTQVENIEKLGDLCDEFGYSYTHISQKFTSVMGESLKSYYTRRRFEKARENLQKGNSVTKIAEMMGYKSIHAFSRAFTKYVGMTPSDYKRWADENREKPSF